MLAKLALLFTVIPLLELWLLIELGQRIGTWETLAVVLLTGLAGAMMAKQEGLHALHAIRLEAGSGRMPASMLFEGLLILAGAITLISPGLLTDFVGLSLLFPFTRRLWRRAIERRVDRWLRTGTIRIL